LKSTVISLSGPTCAGKNTLIASAIGRGGFVTVVSATTREPKQGEVEGVHYYFKPRDEFKSMIRRGDLIEHAEVHGEYYGTPYSSLDAAEETGRDIIFDVDVQGALQLKKKMAKVVTIFILPPSRKELMRRIRERNRGETEGEIQVRLDTADWEMSQVEDFDYFIMNKVLDQAVADLLELRESLKSGRNDSLSFRDPSLLRKARAAFV
jgi:guanylate kinase